ncbi:hypothetical protein SODG_002693 [Sodalis praecaptivus]
MATAGRRLAAITRCLTFLRMAMTDRFPAAVGRWALMLMKTPTMLLGAVVMA